MAKTEVISPTQGKLGTVHEIVFESPDSMLVMQLPRETRMLSDLYMKAARDQLAQILPADRKVLLIGCDVNIYELTGADATAMRLKGLI